ncbi:MAG: efflux RND transporter periplasmic adaptor subunit, partial [Proteobacteria bacterium]|nr:efflux RND transporter periplasmic adaptor subunit [Pseudomonadota bacterium]
ATAQRDAARAALAQADKPTDVQLTAAKQAVVQAQASKDAAQAAYTGLDQGVPPVTSGTACSNNGALRDETTCTAQKKAAETALAAAQAAVQQAAAQLGLVQQPATEHDIAAQTALVDQARQQVAKARRPYTDFDLEQQELALQQAEIALHARQVPFTAQDVRVAKAAVDQARAQLALAEVNVRETKVVAPIDGTVLERFTSPGATVGPGTPLLTIAPPVVEVVATISESLLGQLGAGQVVTLRASAYPGTPLSGTVVTLTPTIDPRTRTASVRIDPKDTDHLLKPGMMVQVGVVTSANEGALILPKAAVTGTLAPGGSGTVLAIDAGSRVHPVVVTLGVVSETSVEIASGLTEGQQVVTGSTAGLSDGDAVNVQPAPTGTGR